MKKLNDTRKNVTVLLSSYNGHKYLEEQLCSIKKQENVSVEIVVRDDGSTDETVSILKRWEKNGRLKWYSGSNLGPARSFLVMLANAGINSYYAFSDQDDYWLPDKLSTAIDALNSYDDVPALYFCQTQLVDKNLNKIDSVIINPFLTLGEALVYEFIGGCTMVFNSRLRDLIVSYRPTILPMHDVWIYNVAVAIGAKVIFDPNPHILYRQHDNNVIGQNAHDSKEWVNRIWSFVKGKHGSRSDMAKELYNGYGQYMSSKNLNLVKLFVEAKTNVYKRIKLFLDNNYKCSSRKTYSLFKLAVFFNTY